MATYTESFESLSVGSVVTFMTEPEDDQDSSSERVVVRITKICKCESIWEQDGPPGKMFEGEITSEPSSKDGGDEAFGFVFPGGHAAFVHSSPDSDYTDRFTRAGLVMLEAES